MADTAFPLLIVPWAMAGPASRGGMTVAALLVLLLPFSDDLSALVLGAVVIPLRSVLALQEPQAS